MMETEPDQEFDYFLALKLGMSVRRMREEIDGQEYLEWWIYFAREGQRKQLERLNNG